MEEKAVLMIAFSNKKIKCFAYCLWQFILQSKTLFENLFVIVSRDQNFVSCFSCPRSAPSSWRRWLKTTKTNWPTTSCKRASNDGQVSTSCQSTGGVLQSCPNHPCHNAFKSANLDRHDHKQNTVDVQNLNVWFGKPNTFVFGFWSFDLVCLVHIFSFGSFLALS